MLCCAAKSIAGQIVSDTPADNAVPAAATSALLGRLIRHHVRPHAKRLGLAALFMAVTAAAAAINAWLMEPALDLVFIEQDRAMLVLIPLAVVVVATVAGLATYGQSVLMSYVGQRIVADIQVEMHAHLMRADLAFLHRVHTGELISNFLYDANLLRDAVSRGLTGIAKDTLMAIFLVGVMFARDWQLALATVIVLPAIGAFIRKIGQRMRKASAAGQEETGKLSAILNETFEGARLVKAYGMEAHETARTRRAIERRLTELYRAVRIRSAASPLTETMGGVGLAIAIAYGGWKAGLGEMTLGAFGSFVTALLLSYRPLKSLANLNAAVQEGLAAAQRVFAMLDVEPSVKDRPDAKELEVSGGEIRFDHVSFAYANGAAALNDLNLTIPAGKTIALVGPSGAGKTTVLNLIPRFYDVDSGSVRIDGVDVRDVTLASLRRSLALVSQEATLFDDTVRANIAYGRPGATEAEIVAAATSAAAHDFITALPQGYDTVVGEAGVNLSGGQRQRIAIARAMLRNAPILLLDEATSALDSEAERQVQTALETLMEGRTTLVIAHRLSTIVAADCIHVMKAGRVVESGSHAELLAKNGAYAHLYALQFADNGGRREEVAPLAAIEGTGAGGRTARVRT